MLQLMYSSIASGGVKSLPGMAAICDSKELGRLTSKLETVITCYARRDSGPGQLSRYSDPLLAGRSGDRIPLRARFSEPVQTGPRSHPASCAMGTGSFPGIKRPGCGVEHPRRLRKD